MQVRKMDNVRNSFHIRRVKDIKTASSLFLTKEEHKHLAVVIDKGALAANEVRERQKFARQDIAINKYHKNYYKARERLAATINKNRRLMELRFELQRDRVINL